MVHCQLRPNGLSEKWGNSQLLLVYHHFSYVLPMVILESTTHFQTRPTHGLRRLRVFHWAQEAQAKVAFASDPTEITTLCSAMDIYFYTGILHVCKVILHMYVCIYIYI